MNIYPTAMTHCAACNARVKSTRHLCLYLVGERAALSYVLCKRCSAPLRQGQGLSSDVRARIDASLEAEATSYGFTTTH